MKQTLYHQAIMFFDTLSFPQFLKRRTLEGPVFEFSVLYISVFQDRPDGGGGEAQWSKSHNFMQKQGKLLFLS